MEKKELFDKGVKKIRKKDPLTIGCSECYNELIFLLEVTFLYRIQEENMNE